MSCLNIWDRSKNIWNGFKGLDKGESIITNCLTLPYNEKEMARIDPFSKKINYNWYDLT